MMRVALAMLLGGCVVTLPGPEPQPSSGTVVEPAHGALIEGDTATLSLHVAGASDRTDALDVQALADADDLTSWTTIGTAIPTGGSYATDVVPGSDRWPAGGVLRLRVIDSSGNALVDANAGSDATATTIAIANPSVPPSAWTYLAEKPTGSADETSAYYTAIAAPATLDAFKTQYGFPGDEHAAAYYNAGDLGIGRDMHCRVSGTSTACYVSNYGTFGGDRDDAIAALVAKGTPLATVVMVYTPPIDAANAVQFIVYNGAGALATQAQLDTVGDNVSIPQNCLNCHDGRSSYDATAHAVHGARFLPFDPAAFAFSSEPELTLDAQQAQFAALDTMVMASAPTPGEQEIITGMWPSGTYDAGFVPAAWSTTPRDAQVYRDAIAPYCRSCHASFDGASESAAFATPDSLRAHANDAVAKICSTSTRGMPTAQQTATRFYASPARALLLAWLGAPGACAPQ